MRKGLFKRMGSLLLAAAMVLSVFAGLTPMAGADSWPNETASAEPTFAGYRVKDIENWSPETDPYAEFVRASVPLQNRNEAFAATQAKPYLTTDSQIMNMTGDYGNNFFGSTMYTNEFSEDVMTFWQYTDYFSPWHGAATAHTPQSLYDPQNSDWQNRGFEFGIVNIPNPAYTNAAHKNGVMSIACVYFDPAFRPGQTCKDLVGYDNWEEVADQLIAMAEYYGYDGYFMNQEEGGYTNEFKQFMARITAAGLYTQWYDTNSTFNESKAQWLSDDTYGKIHDSVFVNYSSFYNIDSQLALAESLGYDPYESIFYGVEANQGGLAASHSSTTSLVNLFDETGNPRASYALFCASDHYFRGLESINSSADGDPRPTHSKDGYQWMGEERERLYWSGPTEDVTETGWREGYSRPDVGANSVKWLGAAHFIAERSVIDGTSFYTNFNTGHGMQYFVDGEVSKDEEWTNINIQEMMPTWQWWFESTDSTKVHADFDYGDALVNLNVDGTEKDMEFTQVGAWNGGNSLAVYGNLSGVDTMHLYKTDLEVKASSTASVTFKKVSTDNAVMKLGLVFKDAPETVVTLDLANTAVAGDWTTSTVSLADYAGRDIAAIHLVFEGDSTDYQINVGNITVTDGAHTPAAPTGFTLDTAYIDGQMIVRWDMADYSEVVQYNLYGKQSDGSVVYLGGIYGDILYVKNSFAEDTIELQLKAVGVDGTESAPATIAYNYEEEVSSLSVEEAETTTGLKVHAANAGQLDVSFTAPAAGAPDSYEFEVKLVDIASDNPDNQVYTATAEGNATSAVVEVPVEEGYKYDLTIYAVNDGVRSSGISYRGLTHDCYSEPIDPAHIELNNGVIRLVDPDSVDWQYLTAYVNGTQKAHIKRGGVSRFTATMTFNPGITNGTVEVTVTDYSGNVSAPVTVSIVDGAIVDLTMEYGEDQIPDPALRAALQELVGPTMADLINFEGDLDLSDLGITDLTGLTLVNNLKSVDLSGNDFTELTGDMLPGGLEKIILDGCENLELINLDGKSELEVVLGDLPALTTLSLVNYGDYELDLSGCPELYNLYLTGTKMTSLDITANVKLHNFKINNSEIAHLTGAEPTAYTDAYYWFWNGARMDLSEGTPEGEFAAGMKEYFANADLEQELGSEPVVIVEKREMDFYYATVNNVIDLGKEYLLDSLILTTRYPEYYGKLTDFTVQISSDGENYSELVHVTDGAADYTVTPPEGTYARYIKILDNTNGQAWTFWTVKGYDVAPMGFSCNKQRPAMDTGAMPAPTVIHDGTVYDMMELLAEYYENMATVAGTPVADLLQADWVDLDYLASIAVMPEKVNVTILDSEGNEYGYYVESDEPVAGGVILGELNEEEIVPVNLIASDEVSDAEAVEKMFDGVNSTKWCDNQNQQPWAGFETEETTYLGKMTAVHAGVAESSSYNTKAYRLQVLNTEVLAEDDYLAMSEDEKYAILADASYWTDLVVVTDNTATEVTNEIDTETAVGARVYRLFIDQREQTTGSQWAACRIYELSLWGYDYTEVAAEPTIGELDAENAVVVPTGSIFASGETNADEGATKAFDDDVYYSKWCDNANDIPWIVFETEEAVAVGQYDMYHGQEGGHRKTKAWSLQVLDSSKVTEAAYAAMSAEEKAAVAADDSNWVTISQVTDNTESFSETAIAAEEAVIAQVYRLRIDEREQTPGQMWAACRIYDVKLYAYAVDMPTAEVLVKGAIKADEVETYTVIYKSNGNEIARTTFTVDHDRTDEVTVDPTCTEPGHTSYGCTLCDLEFSEEIPALGHELGEGVVTEPTCDEQGYTTYTCGRCGETVVTDYVDALGHEYEAVVTAPTCTEGGYTTYTCSVCGDSYVGDETEALGHDFGEWTVVTEATCTEAGLEERTCSRCGETETREVEALGHDFVSVVVDPTCIEQGYTVHTCTRCDTTYTDTYIAPQGHVLEMVVVKEPTDTENGILEIVCSVCGEKESVAIYAVLEGNLAEWTTDSGEELSFLINSGEDELYGVIIDDMYVNESAYTVGEDGTVTLNPEFLATLEEGEHVMMVVYGEGLSVAVFTVVEGTVDPTEPEVTDPEVTDPETTEPEVPGTSKPAGDNDSADTSDAAPMLLMTALLLASAAAMVVLLPKFRRED